MSEEEINAAIALECGYKFEIRRSYRDTPPWFLENVMHFDGPPNYYRSHGACSQMRRVLTTPELRVAFLNTLRRILEEKLDRAISDFDLLNSEPEEQSESFLKVFKKWRG